ncbi:hypothetical protein [uncultured Nostoc sp.]|uniref:hypothetical protein n=1 Tax=uncultured Nostoc sp. TaxID=340711 RepID=UPI0035CAC70B
MPFFNALNGHLVATHKTPEASILQQFKGQARRSPIQIQLLQDGQHSERSTVRWGASTDKSSTVGGFVFVGDWCWL